MSPNRRRIGYADTARGLPRPPGARRPAALPHLRQRRRRQVDPDRPAALRHQADLRGSAGGAADGQPQARHHRRRHRLRPAGRRPAGRARAGHHHRRRLSLLLHRQAQVHRRRHARATSSTPATWRPARRTADLAVILVDARKGVLTQTRRHSFIVSLLGIRHVVLAVNKIDLVDFDEARFDAIVADYRAVRAPSLGFKSLVAIPLSARYGDNMIEPAPARPGTPARRCSSIWRPSRWTTTPAAGRSACRCSG